jgi:hypothetical protein
VEKVLDAAGILSIPVGVGLDSPGHVGLLNFFQAILQNRQNDP